EKHPDIDQRVLDFTKPVEPANGDDELVQKLKERHNVAASLLEARADEYKIGLTDLAQVLAAAKLVAESKYELAQDDMGRLAVLDQTLEVAKLVEGFQQEKFDAGVGSRSDLQHAKLTRLNVEVSILKLKHGK